MPNKTSQHILNTAANLLGFCLIVITSLHVSKESQNSLVDEFSSLVALLLTIACVFSFASLKTDDIRKETVLEKTADILFLIALLGIFVIIIFLVVKLWNN